MWPEVILCTLQSVSPALLCIPPPFRQAASSRHGHDDQESLAVVGPPVCGWPGGGRARYERGGPLAGRARLAWNGLAMSPSPGGRFDKDGLIHVRRHGPICLGSPDRRAPVRPIMGGSRDRQEAERYEVGSLQVRESIPPSHTHGAERHPCHDECKRASRSPQIIDDRSLG